MAHVSLHGKEFYFDTVSKQAYVGGRPLGDTIRGRETTRYVDSAVDAASGRTPDEAMGTLQEAIDDLDTLGLDNTGATIVVMPNHAETITGVGGLTFDVAGINVIGLGSYNQRPRFLMDGGTTVTAAVTAADVTVKNLVFAGGHNGVVTCFDVTASGFVAEDIEYEDNATDEHFLSAITATSTSDNTADGLTVIGNKWYSPDSGILNLVNTAADIARLTVKHNLIIADAATAVKTVNVATGKSLQGVEIAHNKQVCGNSTSPIMVSGNQTDNTGIAYGNLCRHHDVGAMELIDLDGIGLFENYSAQEDGKSGALEPAADSIT